MGRIRDRLTYANVMVTVLAFVVLGGTAWAVAKNSVGSKQIKAGAVKTADIADQAITAEKVQDGSLSAADLAPGVAGGDTIVRSKTETVALTCTETNPVPGTYFLTCSGQATVSAACQSGEQATGGGYTAPAPPTTTSGPTSGISITDNRPEPTSGTPNGWALRAVAFGSNSGPNPGLARPADPEVTAYAVCST